MVNRENTLALKSLSKKEPKRDGLKEGNLRTLFEDKEVDGDMGEKNSDGDSDVDIGEGKLRPNILDRNKNQLIEDQQSDVTLYKVRNAAADIRLPWKQMVTLSTGGYSCIASFTKTCTMEPVMWSAL